MPTMTGLLPALLIAAFAEQDSTIVLPAPTGPHQPGVMTRIWVDSSRMDSFNLPPRFRRVTARIWYPSDPGGAPAAYVEELNPTASELGALHARVRPHARADVPFASKLDQAPVIVFAPGRVAAAFDYTTLAEDLASHGYVVAAINSPGHSKIFRPDGTLEPVLFGPMPPNSYPNGFDDIQEPMNRLISADLRFALRQLVALDRAPGPMRGRLDLQRVGMAGHSNGAMAGSRACANEALCRAFLGIEGSQVREIRLGGNDKPFGLVYSEQTLTFDSLGIFTGMRARGSAPFWLYRVAEAGHNSFTDLLLVRPTLFNYAMKSSRAVEVTRSIVRGFFDRNLRGNPKGEADVAALQEVRVERFQGGRAPPAVELFGAGVFSTGVYELPPTFERDGGRAYFTVSTPQYGRRRWIMESRRTASGWTAPAIAPFSGSYDDADPYISPDGSQLFFLSKRPVGPGQPAKRDLDIWVMARDGAGWGQPRHLGSKVNGPADEHYVTATDAGALFIAAVRPDSRNLGDLYEVPREGSDYGEPRNLGPLVNGPESHETTPWVSPDGSYIIFAARGRSDSYGDLDLYITFRDSATAEWRKPVNLGQWINSPAVEYCPIVSPDGQYLYFTSTRGLLEVGVPDTTSAAKLRTLLNSPGNGLGDTYRVAMRDVLAGIKR